MIFGQQLNSHRIFKQLAKALISLRVCAGWSEPLLVIHTTLFEILCHSSYGKTFIFTTKVAMVSSLSAILTSMLMYLLTYCSYCCRCQKSGISASSRRIWIICINSGSLAGNITSWVELGRMVLPQKLLLPTIEFIKYIAQKQKQCLPRLTFYCFSSVH